MEDSEATAALAAFGVLAKLLMESGAIDREELIENLQLATQNLQSGGLPTAAAALGGFLAGTAPAWRMAGTRGHTPN